MRLTEINGLSMNSHGIKPAAQTTRSQTENRPLLPLVVPQKNGVIQTSDINIWAAVLDLVAQTRQLPQSTTPPPSHLSFTSSFQQTPWSFNTSSFAHTPEHRKRVDDAVREGLLPGLRLDIPDFVHAVFGQVPRLDELAKEVSDICQQGNRPLYIHGSG